MPIGVFPPPIPPFFPPHTDPAQIPLSLAVALLPDGAGSYTLEQCSCTVNAKQFYGFASSLVGPPWLISTPVYTVRGTLARVVTEDGSDLVENQPVYLSHTLGKVTQTPPSGPNDILLCVGFALKADTIYLKFDFSTRM